MRSKVLHDPAIDWAILEDHWEIFITEEDTISSD